MTDQNLFAEDWINCLRAHYTHVVHEQDTNNEQSLITVLVQTGFTQEDIDAMRSEATAGMEVVEQEIIALEEEAYQWVVDPPEARITPVTEEAYQWVIEPEPVVESIVEVQAVDSPEVDAAIEPDVPADSDEGEPPESFVQMSMF